MASDGTAPIFTAETVVSTTSGTKVIELSGVDLLRDDERLQAGDRVVLTGTSGGAGDGTFTVSMILTITTFNVVEAIGTSTGGTANATHPVGGGLVGIDPTGLGSVSSTNAQGAVEELDAAVGALGGTDRAWRRHFLLMGG